MAFKRCGCLEHGECDAIWHSIFIQLEASRLCTLRQCKTLCASRCHSFEDSGCFRLVYWRFRWQNRCCFL